MQKKISHKRPSPSKKIWKAHLQAWRKSGLNGMEYCRQHTLSYHAFNYWKKKYHRPAPPEISFVPVPAKQVMSTAGISSPGSTLKVEVGNRFKIEVCDGFSSQTLSNLISTLEGCR